jgi:hypothetical protein
MEVFLFCTSLLFLVFGSMLLLTPKAVERIASATNKVLFTLDTRVHTWRRPMGITLLILTIVLWFIAFSE